MEKLAVKTFGFKVVPESTISAVLAQHSSLGCEFTNFPTTKRVRLSTAMKGVGVWIDSVVVFVSPVSEHPRAVCDISEATGVIVACVNHQGKVLSIAVEGKNVPISAIDFLVEEEDF